jgi:hypothetical protein
MTVYSTDMTQEERFRKELRKGNIPLVCNGDCEGVGSVTPERLADIVDPEVDETFGVHEPCGEKMHVPELAEQFDAEAILH